MPRNHRPVFGRESMPWARDVDRDLDEVRRELSALRSSARAASTKATANASGTQRQITAAGAAFRKPGSNEQTRIIGDMVLFGMDGRERWMGSLDCQLSASDEHQALTYLSAWNDQTGVRSYIGIGLGGLLYTGDVARVDLRVRTSHLEGAYIKDLRVGTSIQTPTGQGGAYREAADRLNFVNGVPAGGTYVFTIIFPAGRFTQVPVVTASVSRARISIGVVEEMLNGFTVMVENWSGTDEPEDFVIRWHATQMSPNSGAG